MFGKHKFVLEPSASLIAESQARLVTCEHFVSLCREKLQRLTRSAEVGADLLENLQSLCTYNPALPLQAAVTGTERLIAVGIAPEHVFPIFCKVPFLVDKHGMSVAQIIGMVCWVKEWGRIDSWITTQLDSHSVDVMTLFGSLIKEGSIGDIVTGLPGNQVSGLGPWSNNE